MAGPSVVTAAHGPGGVIAAPCGPSRRNRARQAIPACPPELSGRHPVGIRSHPKKLLRTAGQGRWARKSSMVARSAWLGPSAAPAAERTVLVLPSRREPAARPPAPLSESGSLQSGLLLRSLPRSLPRSLAPEHSRSRSPARAGCRCVNSECAGWHGLTGACHGGDCNAHWHRIMASQIRDPLGLVYPTRRQSRDAPSAMLEAGPGGLGHQQRLPVPATGARARARLGADSSGAVWKNAE